MALGGAGLRAAEDVITSLRCRQPRIGLLRGSGREVEAEDIVAPILSRSRCRSGAALCARRAAVLNAAADCGNRRSRPEPERVLRRLEWQVTPAPRRPPQGDYRTMLRGTEPTLPRMRTTSGDDVPQRLETSPQHGRVGSSGVRRTASSRPGLLLDRSVPLDGGRSRGAKQGKVLCEVAVPPPPHRSR